MKDDLRSVLYYQFNPIIQLCCGYFPFDQQFIGLSDHLWLKLVSRQFQNISNPKPAKDETWSQYHRRLGHEEAKRLDRIISKSALKTKQEQEGEFVFVMVNWGLFLDGNLLPIIDN